MKKKNFKSTLWSFIFSPLTWAVYMTVYYVTVAIWCAKAGRDSTIDGVRVFIAVLTAVALFLIGTQMVKNFRRHTSGNSSLPHDEDTVEDRERFLGFANFLISSLSAIAILFLAFNVTIFRSCQ